MYPNHFELASPIDYISIHQINSVIIDVDVHLQLIFNNTEKEKHVNINLYSNLRIN